MTYDDSEQQRWRMTVEADDGSGGGGREVAIKPHTSQGLAVWCSGNALVSINAVALHRARLVLGWVTAFGQVNCLIT